MGIINHHQWQRERTTAVERPPHLAGDLEGGARKTSPTPSTGSSGPSTPSGIIWLDPVADSQ